MAAKSLYDKDTTAGRAYALLMKAQQVKADKATGGWSQVFGVPADNRYEIKFRVAQLLSMVVAAHRDFRSKPENTGQRDDISSLVQILSNSNLEVDWSTIRNAIEQARTLLSLTVVTSDETPELPDLPKDERKEWETTIADLINDVRDSEIDDDLKAFIVKQLVSIQNALIYFELDGMDGLLMSVYASSFAFRTRPEVHKDITKTIPTPLLIRIGEFFCSRIFRLMLKKVGGVLISEKIDDLAKNTLDAVADAAHQLADHIDA